MNAGLHGQDPSARLVAAFRRIAQERMAGLPIVNPALGVEAIGFRRWSGHWLGMLVTPWSISVVLLPADDAAWQHVTPPQRRFVRFPFGDLAFLQGEEPELGAYQACSLFASMESFDSQAVARATAQASLAALLEAPPQAPAAAAPAAQPVPARRRFLGLRA